jgi:hypothetical protein
MFVVVKQSSLIHHFTTDCILHHISSDTSARLDTNPLTHLDADYMFSTRQ